MIKRKSKVLCFFVVLFISALACKKSVINPDASIEPPTASIPLVEPISDQPSIPSQPRSVTPEELVPHIAWDGWGSGGMPEECIKGLPFIYIFAFSGSLRSNYSIDEKNPVVIGEQVEINGCGFSPREQIQITLFLPNNTQEQFKVDTSEYGSFFLNWWATPGVMMGKYQIEVASVSSTLYQEFWIGLPSKPIFIADCMDKETPASGVLTGFAPFEEVLMASYSCCGMPGNEKNLVDHWYVQVNQDGTAVIQLPKEDILVTAIGKQRLTEIGGMWVSAFDWMMCQE